MQVFELSGPPAVHEDQGDTGDHEHARRPIQAGGDIGGKKGNQRKQFEHGVHPEYHSEIV